MAQIGDLKGRVSGLLHLGLYGLRRTLGLLRPAQGVGTANTALAFHAGRLLALNECDLPYAVCLHQEFTNV